MTANDRNSTSIGTTLDYSKGRAPRRWPKRVAIGFAVLVLLVGGAWVGVSLYGRWRMSRTVAAIRAAGEPVTPEDVDAAQPDVPDDQNAAALLSRAGAAVTITPEQQAFFDTPRPALGSRASATAKLVAELIESNRSPLDLARRARSLEKVHWPTPARAAWSSLGSDPEARRQRDLSDLLTYAGQAAHSRGDDAEAIELMDDQLRAADAYQHDAPILVHHLTAIGLTLRLTSHAAALAPTLHIATTQPTPTQPTQPQPVPIQATSAHATATETTMPSRERARPASPAQVRALIDRLLDERDYRTGWRDAMRGERVYAMNIAWIPGAGVWPLRNLALGRVLEREGLYQHVAAASDLPTALANARAVLPAPSAPSGVVDAMFNADILASILAPSLNRALPTHYAGLATRRLLAAALAVRWYMCEHDGGPPPTLDALVPRYLPAVPIDPLAAGSRPISYRAGDAPIVYSVGEDGVDDGGATAFTRAGTVAHAAGADTDPPRPLDQRCQDLVLSLTRTPRTQP